MTTAVQLDFFETYDELEILRRENKITREQLDNLRRGLFARFNKLEILCLNQAQEIETLKSLLKKEQKLDVISLKVLSKP